MAIHYYYENGFEANDHFEQEMTQLMCKAINDKQKSFNTNFRKVCVVDRAFGLEFHKGTQNHYDSIGDKDTKMTFDKLHLLTNSLVEPAQKSKCLKWRNSK